MAQPCWKCNAEIPEDHMFCGQCGASMSEAPVRRTNTQPFSTLIPPGKARLIVLKGTDETFPGMSFHLNADACEAGRDDGALLFEDDDLLSTPHARFAYNDEGSLLISDDGSLNGSYIQTRGPTRLKNQDRLRIGGQIFQFEYLELADAWPTDDGTMAYVSPQRACRFRLMHILEGGHVGQVVSTSSNEVTIGREGCDLNFPGDGFVSERHAKIHHDDKGFVVEDLGSVNGTFLKIREPRILIQGDLIFMGRQLLRVELN